MKSMLRDWVMDLPLREQGVLLVSLRGCDAAPKMPLDSPERRMTAALRYTVCVPFDDREVSAVPGAFMSRDIPVDVRLAMFEHYPLHWVVHIIHACEVIGYRHPDRGIRECWRELYFGFCRSMHVTPETFADMVARLGEDRVAARKIVTF